MHFSISRNVVLSQLDHAKSDSVPSTFTRIVTVTTAATLNSVQIYRTFERTVPCALPLFYFCFVGADLYGPWSVVSQAVLTAHVAAGGGEINKHKCAA